MLRSWLSALAHQTIDAIHEAVCLRREPGAVFFGGHVGRYEMELPRQQQQRSTRRKGKSKKTRLKHASRRLFWPKRVLFTPPIPTGVSPSGDRTAIPASAIHATPRLHETQLNLTRTCSRDRLTRNKRPPPSSLPLEN